MDEELFLVYSIKNSTFYLYYVGRKEAMMKVRMNERSFG
jgi:hypothetical protein